MLPGFSTSGVIAVTPEGIVRHWSMPDRQFSDSSVDLDREVALSLTRINLQSSGFVIHLFGSLFLGENCRIFVLIVDSRQLWINSPFLVFTTPKTNYFYKHFTSMKK